MPPLLTMPHKQAQRLQMIEQALKDLNPQMYRELKQAGRLKAFLESQEQQMMESYDQAVTELQFQVSGPKGPKGYMETVQALEMGTRRIWEETLATFLEFGSPEDQITESAMES